MKLNETISKKCFKRAKAFIGDDSEFVVIDETSKNEHPVASEHTL